jgi:hypothetical protein
VTKDLFQSNSGKGKIWTLRTLKLRKRAKKKKKNDLVCGDCLMNEDWSQCMECIVGLYERCVNESVVDTRL